MNNSLLHSGAVLTVDLGAIRANYRMLKRLLKEDGGSAECAAVVKADAYGLGAAQVATSLLKEGCKHFFVAHLDEGIRLRSVLPGGAQIYVLHGPLPGAEPVFGVHRLIPVLSTMEQVAGWRRLSTQLDMALPAVIQADTGMSRLGLAASDVARLHREPDLLRGIDVRYLMSHLACAEEQEHPANEAQRTEFEWVRSLFPRWRASFANSSGIFLGRRFHFDLARPGAALYGLAPVSGAANPLRQPVQLKARILQVRDIAAGVGVGYGLTYKATGPRRIATLSIGYADGWARSLSNRGAVWFDGAAAPLAAPLAGIVSMDTCSVDVTGIPEHLVAPGRFADLISPANTVDDVARAAGTIGYDVLTGLGQRYCRQYLDAA
jgi:alanine racemase